MAGRRGRTDRWGNPVEVKEPKSQTTPSERLRTPPMSPYTALARGASDLLYKYGGQRIQDIMDTRWEPRATGLTMGLPRFTQIRDEKWHNRWRR
jgi:hypothetical protein